MPHAYPSVGRAGGGGIWRHDEIGWEREGEGIGNLNLAREIVEARCGTTCCTKRAIGPRFEIRRPWRES
jgi:hypothetical protein